MKCKGGSINLQGDKDVTARGSQCVAIDTYVSKGGCNCRHGKFFFDKAHAPLQLEGGVQGGRGGKQWSW